MKKLIIILVVLVLLGLGGYLVYSFLLTDKLEDIPIDQEPGQDKILENIENVNSGNTENDIDDEEIVVSEESNAEIQDPLSGLESANNVRRVPTIPLVNTYSGAFLEFSYPNNWSAGTEDINGIEFNFESEIVGAVDIFMNPEKLPLQEYVAAKENVIDYFTEYERLNNSPFEIDSNAGAKSAYMFKDFPGLKTHDVYLLEFDEMIVRVLVWDHKEIARQVIISSVTVK